LSYNHEAEVEAFMATARMSDPERHALVCSKYQVKSARQMRRIAEIEIPVGLQPGKFSSDKSITQGARALDEAVA
jgi:hypothetical protein